MILLTKIFHFEMAHAIHGYAGACRNIHGHSYELHVTVTGSEFYTDYIPAPGIVLDYKEIKSLVKSAVINQLDHKMILSEAFLSENPFFTSQENLLCWEAEPTAENILVYIWNQLNEVFCNEIRLVYLKLYETKDSYAEWIGDTITPALNRYQGRKFTETKK